MLEIEKWACSRPFIIRIIAQEFALSAYDIFEVLDYVKTIKIPKQFKQPTIIEWIPFYQGETDTTNKLMSSIHKLAEPSALGAFLFRRLSGEDVEPPSIYKDLTDEEIYQLHLFGVKEDITNTTLTSGQREFIEEEILTSSFLFHITVAAPCLILWFQKHTDLFKLAVEGNPDALEKLFRLDKLLIQHQEVSKWITYYAKKTDPTIIEKLTHALCKPIKDRFSKTTIKYFLSGQISLLTEGLGHRLEAPEIQALFDAIAVDYGKDELRDTDLPDSPEAFSKAVHRQRNLFIKNANSVLQ